MEIELIDCPACGKRVSSQASSCPQCGQPINTGQSENNTAIGGDQLAGIKIILCAILAVVMIIFSTMRVDPLLRLAVGIILCAIAFAGKGKLDSTRRTNNRPVEPALPKDVLYIGRGALWSMIIGAIIFPIIFAPIAVFLGLLAVSKKNKLGWWGIIGGGFELIWVIMFDFI